MVLEIRSWTSAASYELPIERIKAVVVERKSVMPFATLTVLAAAVTVLAKYNALWFIVNLAPENVGRVSSVAFLAAAVCAIPTLIRTVFVNVSVTWDGQPATFRIGFMPVSPGKHLAMHFQELSTQS
jgi:hypothetical protein